MTYLAFVVAAAICSAFMDTIENENFHVSRFSNLNQRFWYKRKSWQTAKVILGYKLDAWHIAKSIQIISFACGLYFAQSSHQSFIVVMINVFLLWNIVFWLFYYKIFR